MMRDWSELRVEVEEVKALLVKARLAEKTKKELFFWTQWDLNPRPPTSAFVQSNAKLARCHCAISPTEFRCQIVSIYSY